jgi:hypothetical protein
MFRRWRQQVPPKRRYLSTKIIRRYIFLIGAVKSSNITQEPNVSYFDIKAYTKINRYII